MLPDFAAPALCIFDLFAAHRFAEPPGILVPFISFSTCTIVHPLRQLR